MPLKEPENQSPGLTLADIYYILFRHKKLVLWFPIGGVLLAAAIYFLTPTMYQSEAELLVRYILESKSINPMGSDSQIKSPDSRGDNIINSELEILTSRDLIERVVDALGPSRILAKAGGGTNRLAAIRLITKNLTVDVPKKSNVIRVIFQYPDADVVQPVLEQLVQAYLRKHVEIHQPFGALGDFLSQQTLQLKNQLQQTEEQLRKAKEKYGVIYVDDSRKTIADQMLKIRQSLYDAETELEQHQVLLKQYESLVATNAAAATNSMAAVQKIDDYRNLGARLDALKKRESEMMTQYTDEFPALKRLREQMEELQKQKREFEKDNPSLAGMAALGPDSDNQPFDPVAEKSRVAAIGAKIEGLTFLLEKIQKEAATFEANATEIQQWERKRELEETNYRYFSISLEQARIDESLGEGRISNISTIQKPSGAYVVLGQLKKPLAVILALGMFGGIGLAFFIELFFDQTIKRPTDVETKLRLPLFLSIPDFAQNGHSILALPWRMLPSVIKRRRRKSEVRGQRTEDGGRRTEGGGLRTEVRGAGPDYRTTGLQTTDQKSEVSGQKAQGGGLKTEGGGLMTEDSLNADYETTDYGTKTPKTEDRRQRSKVHAEESEISNYKSEISEAEPEILNQKSEVKSQKSDTPNPKSIYFDALRDRLVTYFEVRNMTHKPKLVGVTGCSKGVGVTSVASGLAASLSETGDGKVLYVDMNQEQGMAHPFYKGEPVSGLEEVLEDKRNEASQVQDKLYMVKANDPNSRLPRLMPKRFSSLVPKLKASDYDYIIFDMPAVSQTSITPRLAGFLDMVLMVIESEKTQQDAAKRANTLLAESKANVTAILNKTHTYVPPWLYQEI